MNKIEVSKGLYRQNVYNVNLGNGHYNHLSCYFDKQKNIIAVFKAGDNTSLINFTESNDLTPLVLSAELLTIVKNILLEWTYDHIESIDLYNPDSIWNRPSMSGIFEITDRDNFVISSMV